MSNEKCYSLDEENFNYQELNDVIDTLHSTDALAVGTVFWEAEAVKKSPSYFFSIETMLENISEAAYDTAGEYAEGFPGLLKQDVAALELMIQEFLDAKCAVDFWGVENTKKIEVTQEMIDDFLKATAK